ncbi:hypothetical protein KBD75_02405 [Candidatus Woesebacteria bacterium]|nr:hypothetical protein [Candidatus Woesebacteria bacterium]
MQQSLIFFGSDHYSAVALSALLASGLYPLSSLTVVTDHHQGGSPVEQLALSHGLKPTYYPTTPEEKSKFILHLESISSLLESGTPPLGLCASFDHLIPQDIIKFFGGNLYNLHPSLLPQYRNVSPVQYAIALGDTETGITLFRIAPTIDDGEIIAQVQEAILPTDTTSTLTPRLFQLGAELFLSSIKNNFIPSGILENRDTRKLIYTHRLTRDSGYIEWSVLHKLLKNEPVSSEETKNELLSLRLSERPLLKRNSRLQVEKGSSADERRVLEGPRLLSDLLRALSPWPGIWSTIPTKKGNLRISIVPVDIQYSVFCVLISGKPKAITYADFTKYYL